MRFSYLRFLLILCVVGAFGTCGGGGGGEDNGGPTQPIACSPSLANEFRWVTQSPCGIGISQTGVAAGTLSTTGCVLTMKLVNDQIDGDLVVNFGNGTASFKQNVERCSSMDNGTVKFDAAFNKYDIELQKRPASGCCDGKYKIVLTQQ